MKLRFFVMLLIPLLLNGCGSDSLADRIYAQALSLSEDPTGLHLTLQSAEDESVRTVRAASLAEAFHLEEAQAGGQVFIGHTELICIDRSVTPETLRGLFYENGISPGCKLFYTPADYLQAHDSTPLVHTLRLAEQNGLLPRTDLSTVLEEWLGAYQTALLPAPGLPLPGFVLMHTGGGCIRLTDRAARGMLWLRHPPQKLSLTAGDVPVDVRGVHLQRSWENNAPLYVLTMQAPDSSPELCRTLEQQITADCQAAADAAVSANADVIGLQMLLEKRRIPLPEQLPSVTVRVHVMP